MAPCVYCHRKSVVDSDEGPLCTVCAQDAQHEDAETELWARHQDEDGVDKCVYPNTCFCTECVALEVVLRTWSESPL